MKLTPSVCNLQVLDSTNPVHYEIQNAPPVTTELSATGKRERIAERTKSLEGSEKQTNKQAKKKKPSPRDTGVVRLHVNAGYF